MKKLDWIIKKKKSLLETIQYHLEASRSISKHLRMNGMITKLLVIRFFNVPLIVFENGLINTFEKFYKVSLIKFNNFSTN